MPFFDRYEFEQILDQDLAISPYERSSETLSNPRTPLASNSRFNVRIWRTISIGFTAAGLGFTLFHQPSFAQRPQVNSDRLTLMHYK